MGSRPGPMLQVGIMLGFVVLLVTASMLLGMVWMPLGFVPLAVYTYWAGRYNLQRCVCGHRFISHNPHMGWCFKCTMDDDAFVRVNGVIESRFCKFPQTAGDYAERMLHESQ